MKTPIKIAGKEDREAVLWLVKFALVYLLVSQVIWNMSWFRQTVVESYRPVLAWELEKTVSWFGLSASRKGPVVMVEGSPFAYSVAAECTGFFGGFFVFMAVTLTLPAPSWRPRAVWLLAGALVMAAVNLARLTAVLVISSRNPDMFEPVHGASDILNMAVGGGLSLLAAHFLFLKPNGIRLFRR